MHTVLRVPRISSGSLFAKRFFAVLSRGSVEYGRILTPACDSLCVEVELQHGGKKSDEDTQSLALH